MQNYIASPTGIANNKNDNDNNKNAFQSKTCFDLDLGPMTFVLKLGLNMVLIYHCAKKKVCIPSASKVTARTDSQTDTQTDRHTDTTKTLPLQIRGR